VTETDAGGQLTVDHYQPQSLAGSDDLSNLLYCCYRCNLYKADYWPVQPGDPALWNPRQDGMAAHLLTLANGLLYPITAVGAITLQRLRLNRQPLVDFRRRKQSQTEELRLLGRYRDLVGLLEQLQQQRAALLQEHRDLLKEQRALLQLLLQQDNGPGTE
jgi:hypothetical protein